MKVMIATANVASPATGEIAPNDVKNKIIAIIKYVVGSMIKSSFHL